MEYLFDNKEIFDIPDLASHSYNVHGLKESTFCSIFFQEDYDAHLELYNKIAQALQLGSIEDHLQILIKNSKRPYLPLTADMIPETKQIISFGVGPNALGFPKPFQKNTLVKTETFNILFTDLLGDLAQDTSKKKSLWSAVQKTLIST